jgi:glycosyltransferase involved in cell wall biosynthesis
MKTAIIFEQFGPYHHARVAALQAASPVPVVPVQMAAHTTVYDWASAMPAACEGLVTLCPGGAETLSPIRLFFAARRFFRDQEIQTVLLPSYSPASSLAVLLAAMSCRARRVMMNESHAGTERAKGWKRTLKRWLVGRFHAALVGGAPQKRHFTNLGMDAEKIFTGYDAIDNEFFTREADLVRQNQEGWQKRLGLPSRYILSLGRMVEKKNLGCLTDAYSRLRKRLGEDAPALVFVGSGDQESDLRSQAIELGLKVAEAGRSDNPAGADVIFYGFRQISENPAFYALADCFVLPSLWEEWGLVVNEAMACGLPVVVSQTAGSAEDLVRHGENGFHFDPNDPEALAFCLGNLIDNPIQREKMGENSRKIIADWGCANFARNALRAIETTTTRRGSPQHKI